MVGHNSDAELKISFTCASTADFFFFFGGEGILKELGDLDSSVQFLIHTVSKCYAEC